MGSHFACARLFRPTHGVLVRFRRNFCPPVGRVQEKSREIVGPVLCAVLWWWVINSDFSDVLQHFHGSDRSGQASTQLRKLRPINKRVIFQTRYINVFVSLFLISIVTSLSLLSLYYKLVSNTRTQALHPPPSKASSD